MTSINTSRSIDGLAKVLWDYNNLQLPLKKSEAILVLGSNDIRVGHYGTQLFLEGFAPLIIFSGGFGVLTNHLFDKPEAEIFADIAYQKGVPIDKILVENKSSNTGENIQYTRELLEKLRCDISSFIVVQKPYMLRRTYATFKKQWEDKEFTVSGPKISYENYPNETISKDLLINIMVGDTQRIIEYPKLGFQIPQEIPDNVREAFEELIKRGFTKHLIK